MSDIQDWVYKQEKKLTAQSGQASDLDSMRKQKVSLEVSCVSQIGL